MKNKIIITILIIIAFLLICGTVLFVFRKKIVEHFIPTVQQIGEIHVVVKNDTAYINSKLVVRNKSFYKIKIDSIKYKVSLFDKVYLNNQKYLGVALQAKGVDCINFSLKIPYKAILNDLSIERKKGDSVSYQINIFLQYSTVLGKVEIPIEKSALIKIPQPPEINIIEITYSKIGMKSILANAKVEIINYSNVNLSIKDISYTMSILKRGKLNGNLKQQVNIKPNRSTFINLPIEVNLKNIGKIFFEVIFNNDNYDYTLTLNAILESTYPIKQSFSLDIVKTGQMELKK
ncbi:MAG: LEA type 2 family protein [Bacteroidia bacterium]|nr:LEA type 2 family protein [Bacteroidia bacterium]